MTLTDSAGKTATVESADPAATQSTEWTFLGAAPADLNVNLSRIESVTVGVSGAGVTGKIYVDYVRTFRPYPAYDLAAYYPLDGDTLDATGNGFDGTAMGDPVFIEGAIGQALEFDGTPAQYVDLGTANPSEITGKLSLALWAKWNGLSGQWQGLIGKRDNWSATETMWQIEANQSTGVLSFAQNAVNVGSGGAVLPIGEWQHVGVSFDGTTAKFFIDGAMTNSAAFSLGPATGAAMSFGCCQANGGNPFNGALDEVRIYDRALRDEEMLGLATLP
jgi:hypothetical protein